jgi:hypothetical protein
MTLRQIGGDLTYTKTSGIYSLEDQIEWKKTTNQIQNYRSLKDVSKFWPSGEVLESSFVFNTDGTKAFIMGQTADKITQFSAEDPYDPGTLSLDGPIITPRVGISSGNISRTFTFADSGNKLYTSSTTTASVGSTIYQYSCQSPYDAKNITLDSTYFTLPGTSSVGIAFSSNGRRMITSGVSSNFISVYNLDSPWDIGGTVTYDSGSGLKHFNSINCFWIDSTGTKLVLNCSGGGFFKYNLSTPWNPSTGTLDNVDVYDLSVSNTSSAEGVFYGDNGNKAYILRDNGDVTQLNLGSSYRANNILSYVNKTSPTISGGPTTGFKGITFQTSGSNVGRRYWAYNVLTDDLYEYTLDSAPEAWDISYAVYNNKSINIKKIIPTVGLSNLSPENDVGGFCFNSSGTKLYILGNTGDLIYELELSTAWDITSYKPFSITISQFVISADTAMQEVTFGDSGTKFYTIGSAGATKQVYQYNLTTAWDITSSAVTATADKTFNINTGVSRDTDPRSVRFSSDGTRMFVLGNQNNKVYQYSLSTAWDVSTSTYSKEFTIGTTEIALADVPSGLAFNDTGTKMFILGDEATNAVYQYQLGTAWDLGTVVLLAPTAGYTVTAPDSNPTGIVFGDSGNKMYIVGNNSDTIRQFNLSVAYDINSTVTLQTSSIPTSYDGDVTGIDFSSDGTLVYVCGNFRDLIVAYRLKTPWDISSWQYDGYSLSTPTVSSGIAIGDGDNKLYWFTNTLNTLYQRDLTTAGIITSGGTNTSKNFRPYDNSINSLGISSVGSYIAMVSDSWLYTFNMSTPYDITSISNDTYNMSALGNGSSILMKDDGSELYLTINASGTPRIYKYPLSTNYNFNTFSTSTFVNTVDQYDRSIGRLWNQIYLSSDGSNLWTLPTSPSHDIFKYDLSTPYDFNTLWYGDYSLTGLLGTNQHTIRFNQDGTRLYVMTLTNIHQLDLSTPFDLRTAVNNNKSVPFALDTTPVSFEVSTDESKFYILGDELNSIFEYTVKTPGDITTAYYFNNLNVSTQGVNPKSSVLRPDGTKIYVLIGTTIYQYSLSTAFDLVTATYESKSFSVSSFATDPRSIVILGDDGKSMAVLDGNVGTTRIYQFYLQTPWDISTAWFERTVSVSGQDAAPASVYIGPPETVSGVTAGSKMYIGGTNSTEDRVYEYTLSTPWTLNSATYVQSFNTLAGAITGLFFNPEGTRMICVADDDNSFRQFTLSTPWDISTAYRYRNVSVSGSDSLPYDLAFCKYGTNAGKLLYIVGDNNDRIYQFYLGAAYDISTMNNSSTPTTINGISVPGRTQSPVLNGLSNSGASGGATWTGLDFNDTGTRVYLTEDANNRILQFNLDTPWDITTLRGIPTKTFPAANANASGMTWGKDGSSGTLGKRLYICDELDDLIYQYDLETAYSVTTINTSISTVNGVPGYKTFSTLSYDGTAQGVEIKSDGTKLYITGSSSDRVVELILDTPWDITSARLPYKVKSVSAQLSTAAALTFKSDGTKMYVMSSTTSDIVYQYSLSTAWDVSTATYESKSFTLQTETIHTGFDITDVYDAGGGNWKQHLYAVGTGNDRIYRYTITATTSTDAKFWDITQFGTVEATSLLVSGSDGVQHSIKVSRDGANAGKYITLVGQTADDVFFYTMGTAYDLSTATLMTGTKDVSAEGTPTGVAVAYGSGVTEGTVFYVVGDTSDTIREYSLKQSGVLTPWASGTITWTLERSLTIGANDLVNITAATDLAVSKNGGWIYVLDGDEVYGFPMEVSHNLLSANKGSLYVATQETTPMVSRFANNGTELYVYGQSGDDINRYTLSIPWLVSSGTFISNSGSLADTIPYGLEVKEDGSRYWIVGSTDIIREYTPSVNYNTTLTTGNTKDIAYFVPDPRSLKFNNDGTKLFVINSTSIWEFEVDNPYDTVAINTQYFASPDTAPECIKFKSDNTIGGTGNGTKFAVFGSTNNTVRTYTCAYAWNVSSVSSTATGVAMDSATRGLAFNANGSRIYLTGDSDQITQHNATDYASDSPTITAKTVVSPIFVDPTGIDISTDGTKMYALAGGIVYEMILDTAYDVGSIYVASMSIAEDTSPQGLHIGDNGSKLTYFGNTGDDIRVYSLATPYNANNYTSFNFQTSVPDINIVGVWVSDDGQTILMLGQSGEKIYKYTTSSPWNFSSWTNSGKSYNLIHRIDSDGLAFSSDGLTMYILSGTQVVEVPLETAWSPETAYTGVISLSGEDSAPVSLCKTSDGLNLYMLGDTGNDISRYTLSPANKINTATYVNAVSHSTDSAATGFTCDSTGSTFWITGPGNDRIYQISNSGSSGSLGSFTQTTNIDISRIDNVPNDVFLSSNGNYLYLTGQQYDSILRFDLTTSNTLVGYDRHLLDISSETTAPISITKSQDSTKLFVNDVNVILQYEISNLSINNTTYSQKSLYVGSSAGGAVTPKDIHLSLNGNYLYVLDQNQDEVKVYNTILK